MAACAFEPLGVRAPETKLGTARRRGPAASGTICVEELMPPAESAKQARTCILVLGMHRSGTSAFARVASLLGAALPQVLNTGTVGDPVDHWEPLPLVECHDEMLWETGGRWCDWRAFLLDDSAAGLLARFKDEISGILAEQFGSAPLFVLKDPRISRFVPLYRDILTELAIAPRYLLVLRNPLAVMMSLRTRDDMTPDFAALLWLRHMLDAERATRGEPRAIASYERLMADWRPVMAGVAAGLGLDWPIPPQTAAATIDAFLQPAMQHQSFTDRDLENRAEISLWVKETYQSMRLLERHPDDLSALATLDRVHADFSRRALIFGEACMQELAVYARRSAESLAMCDAVRTELLATQAKLQHETEQAAFHARRNAILEAELEPIKDGSRWRRLLGRLRAFERQFRFRREGCR
jgi:hypothetical protein